MMFYPVYIIDDDPEYFIMSIIKYDEMQTYEDSLGYTCVEFGMGEAMVYDYMDDDLQDYFDEYILEKNSYNTLEEAQRAMILNFWKRADSV